MSDLKEDQYIIGMNSFTNAEKISISRGKEEPLYVHRIRATKRYGGVEVILALGEHPDTR